MSTRVSQAPWTMEALWPTIEAPEFCIMINALRCCCKSLNNIQEGTVTWTRVQEGFSEEKGQIKAKYVPDKALHCIQEICWPPDCLDPQQMRASLPM